VIKKLLRNFCAITLSFSLIAQTTYYVMGETNDIYLLPYYSSFEVDSSGFTQRSNGNTVVNISTDFANTGTHSLKVTNRQSAWNGPQLDVTKYISPEKEFSFSVWVRLEEGTSDTIINLSTEIKKDGSSSYKQFSGENSKKSVISGEWIELSGSFLYTNFDTVSIYIETDEAGTSSSFYIDDVTFKEDTMDKITVENLTPLKDIYLNDFIIGTAIGSVELEGVRNELVNKHFNAVTAENSMKPDGLQKVKDIFNFSPSDVLVQTSIDNELTVIGHTLVWHQQSPLWMNTDVSREEAIFNLEKHITEVLSHYKGKIYSWDVVNEAIIDGATNPSDWKSALRSVPWQNSIGDDYIEIAFRKAAEIDSTVLLYYNDYNLDSPNKREATYNMVKALKEKGVKIDGIGMQGHYNLSTNTKNVEDSIKRFAELGVKVSITELDVTVNQAKGQSSLTKEQELAQALKYAELFKIFKQNNDTIERVTLWGLDDANSWRADRFPLPFDKYLHGKLSYYAIADPVKFIEENPVDSSTIESLTSNAIYGTPIIDGEIDEVWDKAEAINADNFSMAWQGATAKVKTLWNEDYLFVLFEVNDTLLNADSSNVYEHDSVEVFVDENDNKSAYYQEDDSQYRVNFNNLVSYGSGAITDGTFKSSSKIIKDGYVVEIQIPFKTIKGENNITIGFEPQVNDSNELGNRISIAKWNDLTDFSFQNTEMWGRLVLTGKTQ
jgi:endo-1,4-beta-xylanase